MQLSRRLHQISLYCMWPKSGCTFVYLYTCSLNHNSTPVHTFLCKHMLSLCPLTRTRTCTHRHIHSFAHTTHTRMHTQYLRRSPQQWSFAQTASLILLLTGTGGNNVLFGLHRGIAIHTVTSHEYVQGAGGQTVQNSKVSYVLCKGGWVRAVQEDEKMYSFFRFVQSFQGVKRGYSSLHQQSATVSVHNPSLALYTPQNGAPKQLQISGSSLVAKSLRLHFLFYNHGILPSTLSPEVLKNASHKHSWCYTSSTALCFCPLSTVNCDDSLLTLKIANTKKTLSTLIRNRVQPPFHQIHV